MQNRLPNIKQDFSIDLLQGLNPIVQQDEDFQYHSNNFQNQMSQLQNSLIPTKNPFQTQNQNINFPDHTQLSSQNNFHLKNTHMETGTHQLYEEQILSGFHASDEKIEIQAEEQISKPQQLKIQDNSYNPSEHNLQATQQQSSSLYEQELTDCMTRGGPRRKLTLNNLDLNHSDQIILGGKVVSGLEKNIVSLPFRQPVDVQGLDIPDYLQIVKQPMDLRTIKRKMSEDSYLSLDQIYSDIQLIIQNSLRYNSLNPDFIRLTNNFEKSYNKIRRDCQRNMRKLKIQGEKRNQIFKAQNIARKPIKIFENTFPSNDVEITSNYEFKELTKLAKKIKRLLPDEQIELFKNIGIKNTTVIDIKTLLTKQVRALIRQVQRLQKQKEEMIRNEQKKENSHLTTCDHEFRMKM